MTTSETKPVAPKMSAIRALTHAERKKPAQMSYIGGFKNVCFQLGEIILPVGSERNANSATAGVTVGKLKKTEKIQFPILIPHSLGVLKGEVNTVAAVLGRKHQDGTYDAVLVARTIERLSSFNSNMRTARHLVQEEQDTTDVANPGTARLGRSSNSRAHNQVMLAGVVVGARYEDGEFPRFHILLRQDANPDNVIPLTYEARNAQLLEKAVRYGSFIYVDGEYAYRFVPVLEYDAAGNPVKDEAGKFVHAKDAEGKDLRRIQTYIRCTAPKNPAEFDTDFKTPAKWIVEIAEKLRETMARRSASKDAKPAVAQSAEAAAVSSLLAEDEPQKEGGTQNAGAEDGIGSKY